MIIFLARAETVESTSSTVEYGSRERSCGSVVRIKFFVDHLILSVVCTAVVNVVFCCLSRVDLFATNSAGVTGQTEPTQTKPGTWLDKKEQINQTEGKTGMNSRASKEHRRQEETTEKTNKYVYS